MGLLQNYEKKILQRNDSVYLAQYMMENYSIYAQAQAQAKASSTDTTTTITTSELSIPPSMTISKLKYSLENNDNNIKIVLSRFQQEGYE